MNYKELIVWQKAHSLALLAISTANHSSRSFAGEIVTRQLLRAVTSIGANIAEGYGRHEGKEYVRFLQIAYGSANEVDNWLILSKDAQLLPPEAVSKLLALNEEILKILSTMIKKIGKNQ